MLFLLSLVSTGVAYSVATAIFGALQGVRQGIGGVRSWGNIRAGFHRITVTPARCAPASCQLRLGDQPACSPIRSTTCLLSPSSRTPLHAIQATMRAKLLSDGSGSPTPGPRRSGLWWPLRLVLGLLRAAWAALISPYTVTVYLLRWGGCLPPVFSDEPPSWEQREVRAAWPNAPPPRPRALRRTSPAAVPLPRCSCRPDAAAVLGPPHLERRRTRLPPRRPFGTPSCARCAAATCCRTARPRRCPSRPSR